MICSLISDNGVQIDNKKVQTVIEQKIVLIKKPTNLMIILNLIDYFQDEITISKYLKKKKHVEDMKKFGMRCLSFGCCSHPSTITV